MIVIMAGPGGAGKGTVVSRLLDLEPRLWLSRSWTTRARRAGEPADAYVFVDRRAFEERASRGGFLEWTEFPGTGELYGTPTLDAPEGRDVVLEIELDGAKQIKDHHRDAVMILIVAPSESTREQRLRARGDDDASVARRLSVGAAEEHLGRQLADHVVVNDEVDQAAHEVAAILRAHHSGG
jgi:guanylate kinase